MLKTQREQIIWLAGLLDGEGSFSIGTRNPNGRTFPRVTLHMTDKDVVEHAKEASGGLGGEVRLITSPSRPKHSKPCYAWEVQAETEAYALMVMVYPFMGERRKARIRELIVLFTSYKPEPHPNSLSPEGQKWCPACETYRDQDRFSPNNQRSDGLASYCRRCRREKYAAHLCARSTTIIS